MKSILFNNACVITAHFLLFAWVLLFSKKSQGSLLFLALFNFQDAVQLSAFKQCSFSIISHLQPFVKYFFQVFLKNFFSTLDLRCLSSDSLSIISHLSELVKWFLKSFLFNFLRGYFHFPLSKISQTFSHSFNSSMRFLGFCCRSLTTVIIISHFLRLVNSNFTQFFRHFLCKITSNHHKNLKFQKINSKIHVFKP